MNVLPLSKKTQVLSALVEGASVRSVERMTGVHRDTILRLLRTTGHRCSALMDAKILLSEPKLFGARKLKKAACANESKREENS